MNSVKRNGLNVVLESLGRGGQGCPDKLRPENAAYDGGNPGEPCGNVPQYP